MKATINGYAIIGELKNDNSGYAKWGFANNGYNEVFIKQFLSPVYPVGKSMFSEETYRRKVDICAAFERRKRCFYNQLNQCLTGNIVTVQDFFRFGGKYYIVTEKVNAKAKMPSEIAALGINQRLMIAKVILHCVSSLHAHGIVHNDLKPDNILIKETATGSYTAKVIDFDSGFQTSCPPNIGDELQGDMVYFAPESFLLVSEDEDFLASKAVLTEKTDIFALGIILHQFFCGKIPIIDGAKYNYVFEAVLDGAIPETCGDVPDFVRAIIARMIDIDPGKRPSAAKALMWLTNKSNEASCGRESPAAIEDPSEIPVVKPPAATPVRLDSKHGYFKPAEDFL